MLEIEKIKSFIEAHPDEMFCEIFNYGGWAPQPTCEITNPNKKPRNPVLTVYYVDSDDKEKKVLFRVCEKDLRCPTENKLRRLISKGKNGFNDNIMLHWSVRKMEGGGEQLIIRELSIDDYLKSVELYNKYRLDDKTDAMIIDLQADIFRGEFTMDEIYNRLTEIHQAL